MKIKWSLILYCAICNLPVCFFLCLTSAGAGVTSVENWKITIDLANINWFNTLINFLVSYPLAMIIGCFIPLTKIGRWFTSLFGVKNDTYTGNMPYRLLATLSTSIIYWVILSPSLVILNSFILKVTTFTDGLKSMLITAPIMLLVAYVSSLINDVFAYRAAHSIDNTF